ncbi:MAG: SH3 domain-containing protein [Myxococcota bacterium]
MLHPGLRLPNVLARPLLVGMVGALFATSLACAGLLPETPSLPEPEPRVVEDKEELIYFYVPGDREVDDARFSEWEVGNRLYVGVHDVNLRESENTSSSVIRTLPLGMQVEILEAGPVQVLTQRRNQWYRVRTPLSVEGWVFGAVLSPVRVMLPGSQGGDAPAVITFNPDFGPRVRVRDPSAGEVGREWSLDVEPTSEFVGGVLTATEEPVGNDSQLVIEQCDAATKRCGTARVRIVDGELVAVD